MKKKKFKILFFALIFSSVAFSKNDPAPSAPLLQLSGGLVYSSIDLSRYVNSVSYRGYHARLVTHVKGMFFLSGEYSAFPVHNSFPAWENVHTQKFDLNGHISFATNNNLTRIYVLSGVNRHEWTATRTGYTNLNQSAEGIMEGAIVHVNRWGLNFGCGFSQFLYENIGIFGDYRFGFGNANNFEKVRILDVMTTVGINFIIPYPSQKGKKTLGIGNKIYKWTRKGGK